MSETTQTKDDSIAALSNIGFSYNNSVGSPLLSDVTVSFPEGRTVVVIGRSGSGKSTLLNLIAGLERPTLGTVVHRCRTGEPSSIDFTNSPANKVVDFRRKNIGFVFQRFNLLPDLTVFQNVLIAARVAGMQSSDATDATSDALQSVGMNNFEARLPDSLSGGEAQRVGIARAIVKRPQLLLADEPTGNLDPVTASIVISTLTSAIERIKGALVIVTHDSLIASKFRTVYELSGGSLGRFYKDGAP